MGHAGAKPSFTTTRKAGWALASHCARGSAPGWIRAIDSRERLPGRSQRSISHRGDPLLLACRRLSRGRQRLTWPPTIAFSRSALHLPGEKSLRRSERKRYDLASA